uniref:non-specific serine/threonine protein kinase n=1 Tax=Solanum lycopersicum TaxID=4081 RepID=K4CG98_SOLLC
MGNLVLFDKRKRTIWQSFDHPTDSLLPGQSLVSGRKIVASVSATNRSQATILPGILTRFSYNELKVITDDFSSKLGEGGFGCVYEGTLRNGTKIAVKHLDGVGQVKESFLTEVKAVGGIHHINLVKLIGFCAEKTHRLLIYEYMVNGSLDRWITMKNRENGLTWSTRQRIISDIAKGLAYLHEDCSQKIIHLDIKPQNILLDQYLNAKISDFGLSKLIEKDKSKVVTRMRGTRGYLAPEWLSSVITEKVDVYAFGIVLLEILCGRKNLDWSQADEEDVHLLSVFRRKAEQKQLIDMVDKNNEDMQLHREAVTEMMSLAAWCLQGDFSKRPSMSLVVKALEDKSKSLGLSFTLWIGRENRPVKFNATLELGQDGNLVLTDSDGTLVWSTDTIGKSVSGLNLTEMGNLVLFDKRKRIIWQSFDHPTDSLLPGQSLVSGRKIVASVSATNRSQAQFMKIGPDGHIKVYQWSEVVSDLLPRFVDKCAYPMVCGSYSICTNNGKRTHESRKAADILDLAPILPGILTRFSYNELKIITEDFSRKLGEGGFGCVYEGTLRNGTKIAVKHLDGVGQVKESFLTEVKAVGGIHHINLVKLIGFCAEKTHRLLIYEYMVNGSLDRWITHENRQNGLTWSTRQRIISDIAKGLAYLHEDCSQKIIHLDIKPQNILLDQYFNAKISDFGLSKLIEKDKSKVVTRMRGTPGYLAPEWLSSVITEKVDVYAFGIVLLEILCGRKNLDWSQPDEEDVHLLSVFRRKAEQKQLMDMVDKNNEDMQLHREAVTEMMSLAAWCLQGDFSKRPSMSLVVKALEATEFKMVVCCKLYSKW